MSEENHEPRKEIFQLSWAARSFIDAPSSRVLFLCVSLVLVSVVAFFISSFFITIDRTVRSSGETDSFLGVKEVIALRAGQIESLSVTEGEMIAADKVIGRLKIEGSSEEKLHDYLTRLQKVLQVCRDSDCELPKGTLDVAIFSDPGLKEALTNVSRMFADYRYSRVELGQKTSREIDPLKQRLGLIQKKLQYLAKSKMKNYLLMQKEALDEEKGRLEQQLIATENQLSGTVREKKNEALHSLELAIFQLQNFVVKHQLKVPVSGIVAKLHRSKGSYVKEYDPILAIIPESSPIIARVNIPAKDVSKVKDGDNVFISIDSYPSHKYGYFSGKLLTIEKIASGGQSNVANNFVAKISIDTDSLKRNPAFAFDELTKVKLEPGMGVEVRIVTGKTKLIQLMVDKVLGKER